VNLRKTKFFIFSFIFISLTSFSLFDYLHLKDQERLTNYIISAPEQVFIEDRNYFLQASIYHDGMPSPGGHPLVVSWEINADGFIFPIPLDLIITDKVWLINNDAIYNVDILPGEHTPVEFLFKNRGTINPQFLDPYELQRNASVVAMLICENHKYFLKDSKLVFYFVF